MTGTGRLLRVAAHGGGKRRGMRPGDHGQRAHPVRVQRGGHPGKMPAPVVTHEVEAFSSKRPGDGQDIPNQVFDAVRLDARRASARRVAALVRRTRAKTGTREHAHLGAPSVTSLRETVQQQHQVALLGTGEIDREGSVPRYHGLRPHLFRRRAHDPLPTARPQAR